MKKKILALCLVVVLVATAITGATLAYFTDTDEKTNTFTVGDLNIHIDEWMIEDGEWVPYEDEQKLAPIAQSKAPFNKLVETYNDGSEDAYIRTFVTCPADLYWVLGYGFNTKGTDGVNAEGGVRHFLDSWTDLGKTTVNGEEVYIFVCEHKDAIPAGDSIVSLTKVWVYDTVTNEQVPEEFEVLVFSEGIQSENLTYDEAMAALNGGKTTLEHAADLFNN